MDQNQPIFVLPEGALRSSGKDAQRANIAAAKAIADAVRTTLGPKGMDKMLVDSTGDVIVTNDGVTILEEMAVENPAAKMIVEIAKVQEAEVGDGTTTAVILGGELLKNAENLLEQNIHPTVIAKGYELASKKTQEILLQISEKVDLKKTATLKNIAITAMAGKNVDFDSKMKLADMALQSIRSVLEVENRKSTINMDNIKIEKKAGGSSSDSQIIMGVVLDKERVHNSMPRSIKNAKILLLDTSLEVKDTEIDAKIQITDPSQLPAFVEQEERIIREQVDRVIASGANVVFCQKGIDDLAQHYLAKQGILTVRRVKKSDMDKLMRATNAHIVTNLKAIGKRDLGSAGLVEERKLGNDNMIFVEKCKNPKAVSIVLRGGTEHVVAELERSLKDAIGDLAAAINIGLCVAGGGSIEVELARGLRKHAQSFSGREQLAMQAFADTLETIPRTLAENAGLDPIDMLTGMKVKHNSDKGKWFGVNVFSGKVEDMWRNGVIEPSKTKMQAISSATEVAIMLLRIDDVIQSERRGAPMIPPQGGMPQQGMM